MMTDTDICPECGSEDVTCYDSRNYKHRIRKKRCNTCGYKFETIEIAMDDYRKFESELTNILGDWFNVLKWRRSCGRKN